MATGDPKMEIPSKMLWQHGISPEVDMLPVIRNGREPNRERNKN